MGMKISSFVVAVLLIGLIIVGMYGFVNNLASETAYNIDVDDQYETSFDKTINISSQMSNDYEEIIGDETDNETGWFVDKASFLGLIPHALSLVKNMIKLPFTVVGDIISSLTTYLFLPEWMDAFFSSLILALIIFGLIALILRYRHV